MLVAIVIGAIIIINDYEVKNNPEINRQKFKNRFFNEMYLISFGFPFKHFVDDDDRPTEKKTLELQKMIKLGGFDKYFTLRSFMTFKVVIMIAMLILGYLNVLLVENWHLVSKYLFAIEVEASETDWQTKMMIISLYMIVALIPNYVLKFKVKRKLKDDVKDIPVLQMFIILMLRSDKMIPEIIYSLSKIDTPHKEAFEKGYRIYLRNKGEGIEFLKKHFVGTKFVDTFNLIEDIGEYARSECIRILESNLQSLIEETNMIKQRNDSSRLIFSQASMFVPFVSIITLGALPLIIMGLQSFGGAF